MVGNRSMPDFLSHYYEAAKGPFLSLSDFSQDIAEDILDRIREAGEIFASKRSADYLTIRRNLEEQVRRLFMAKGGKPKRLRPQYMILGSCPWVLNWYREGRELRIPLAVFDAAIVSFTYGDTFPAMRYGDGKPYRQQVYTLAELPRVVQEYGLPQEWNEDGQQGPDRYIEAQVWDDESLKLYLGRA